MKQAIFVLTISSFVFVLSSYIINIWIGKHLGPSDYGIYGIVISLMSLFNVIQANGIPNALSKYIAEDEKSSAQLFKNAAFLQMGSAIIMTILFWVLAGVISKFFHDPTLIKYIRISAFILPVYAIYALYNGFYNGLHKFKNQALINIVYSISKLLTALLLVYLIGLSGAFYAFIAAPAIAILFCLYWPKNKEITNNYKKLIMFSLPLIGFAVLTTLQQSIDLYLVKSILKSSTETGFYTAYQNISRILLFSLASFSVVVMPSISRNIASKNIDAARNTIFKMLRYILMILIPITILISTTSKQIIELVYNKSYLQAADSLSLLIIGFALFSLFTLFANILNGAGQPGKSSFISLIAVIITTLIGFILIPTIHLKGAAIACITGNLVAVIIAAFFVYKYFRQLVPISSLVRLAAAAIPIYIISSLLNPSLIYIPFIYILLFSLYILILYLTKEFTEEDLVGLKKALNFIKGYANSR